MEHTSKFSPEFKEKWASALESEEYKQTTIGILYREGEYCCLGVACAISGLTAEQMLKGGYLFLEEELGFSKSDIEFFYDLNDYQQATFPEIAAIIRREF